MLTRFYDRVFQARLGRGAVRSLEYAMLALIVVVAAAGAITEPHGRVTQTAQAAVTPSAHPVQLASSEAN